jgi:hypothetical protein
MAWRKNWRTSEEIVPVFHEMDPLQIRRYADLGLGADALHVRVGLAFIAPNPEIELLFVHQHLCVWINGRTDLIN